MGNSKKFLSLGLSALSILPIGAFLSSNINAGAGRDQEEEEEQQYYTATFDLNGGTFDGVIYATTCFGGNLGYLLLPEPDYREGYNFNGWRSELGLFDAGEICDGLNSNMHFTAVWEPTKQQRYKAIFDLNGGTYNGDIYATIRFGGDLGYLMLPDPDYREGYKFNGWRSELGLLDAGEICDGLNSNIYFTAVWQPTEGRVQEISERLSSIEKYDVPRIKKYLSDAQSGISDMESRLDREIRSRVDTMRIMDDGNALAEIEAQLSAIDAKQAECKREIDSLKSQFGELQESAISFINQASEAREMLNSINAYQAQDMIDRLESLVRSLEDEMNGGIGMALDSLIGYSTGYVQLRVSELEMMIEDFGMSHMDLFY